MDLLDRLSLELPVVQAGMGGGIAGPELAGAVSRAGGLGTIGIVSPSAMARELRRARALAGDRPICANLLLPFTRRAHVRACIDGGAAAVALFFGFDRRAVRELREAGVFVVHQVGTLDEARRAVADGADALVAQGLEAGGHLLARRPLAEFLPEALEAARGLPVLAAGGIADAEAARRALDAGAAAVVAGSRFLLTEESRAHPEYKRRALGAPRTVVTELFGLSWPARHRVLPNAATDRWGEGGVAHVAGRLSAPLARVLPLAAGARMTRLQRLGLPLYGPAPPLAGMPDRLLEVTPLYAGEQVRAMRDVLTAEEAVRALAPS